MIMWRTANLITRAFRSEATQDWLTGTTFTLSSNRDTDKSQGSATTERLSRESSKQSTPEPSSLMSKDTYLGTATLQRCRSGETGSRDDATSISTTDIVTPHERGDRAEKGRLSSAVIIHDIKVKRESPKTLSRNGMDDQPISGTTEGVTPPLRTLRTKRGFRKPVNARDSVFGSVSMNPFEPGESRLHAGDAPILADVQKTRIGLFPKEESSRDSSDCQLHNGAPLYFHKWTAFDNGGEPTDHDLQLDDEATTWYTPRSDLYALREGTEIETSEIPQERPQDVIPALKEPMNGLPTGEMDTSPDVADREETRKCPNAEMNEAGTVPEGVPGTTPANGSNVKESAPSTKDLADVSNQTSPRKIRLGDKIRGEMKLLTGKLGNKIAAGKKMIGKVV
ncbi:hypothetical protein APHAL10511_004057 [Amanita phalloides]|nr:hypothetical protein APHAL10511_004057 [Amanita phalloides]